MHVTDVLHYEDGTSVAGEIRESNSILVLAPGAIGIARRAAKDRALQKDIVKSWAKQPHLGEPGTKRTTHRENGGGGPERVSTIIHRRARTN